MTLQCTLRKLGLRSELHQDKVQWWVFLVVMWDWRLSQQWRFKSRSSGWWWW